MKLALFGYGKMGKAIEEVALIQGHEVVLKIGSKERTFLTSDQLQQVDVVIEFTTPEAAADNIIFCLEAGVPVVTGSTGWYNRFDEVCAKVQETKGSFFYATNFSIGVNIFFKLNEWLANVMQGKGYEPGIWEQHHIHKKDHPSGTAKTLSEGLLSNYASKKYIHAKMEGEEISSDPMALNIICSRAGEVPGTHVVNWSSPIDKIQITHEAFGREGFAAGAVMAALWVADKKGIFQMNDLLKI